MKKILAFALATSVSLGAFAADVGHTTSTNKAPAARPNPNQTRAKLIEKYDLNKDGKLDKAEIEAMRKGREAEALKKYDANKDGKLDDAERKLMREEQRKSMETPSVRPSTKPAQEPLKK